MMYQERVGQLQVSGILSQPKSAELIDLVGGSTQHSTERGNRRDSRVLTLQPHASNSVRSDLNETSTSDLAVYRHAQFFDTRDAQLSALTTVVAGSSR